MFDKIVDIIRNRHDINADFFGYFRTADRPAAPQDLEYINIASFFFGKRIVLKIGGMHAVTSYTMFTNRAAGRNPDDLSPE
jgi:hypothetical protein